MKKRIKTKEYGGRKFKSIEVEGCNVTFDKNDYCVVFNDIALLLKDAPYIELLEDIEDNVQKDLFNE